MSSNPNHITPVITRTNYEEYFLLYVDNELTSEEKKAVDAFVLLHPDLKEELEILSSARLPADAVSFDNKSTLFADSMKVNTVDESLLLYIDGELPAWEVEIVEAQLKRDATFALQHQLLLKTKLAPEPVLYPNKKELYRKTERRVAPFWLRVAAAVVLIAGAGTTAWFALNPSISGNADVAVATPKTDVQKTTPEPRQIQTPLKTTETNAVATNTAKSVIKEKNGSAETTLAVIKRPAKKTNRPTFSKRHTNVENTIASTHLPAAKNRETPGLETAVAEKKSRPAINNSHVTSEVPSTYVSIDAAAKTTVPVAAVATTTDSERGGGSVKGFLRKATRFIERRTGIKAVNDDDELLVGAVALKLK